MQIIERLIVVLAIVFITFCLTPGIVLAQDKHAEPSNERIEAGHTENGHHEGAAHHHQNEFAVMLGGTYEGEAEETYLTLGLKYIRVLDQRVSASIVVEHIFDADTWVFVAPFHIRPWKSSQFHVALGPGIEVKSIEKHGSGHHEESHSGHETPVTTEEDETFFL